MCFVWISEQTAIISLYSINWLVFITETECVYCAVRTGSLYIILRSAHTMCFVWIWEQTAIISLYSINWLVFITETECVYCAIRNGSLYTRIILRSAHTVYLCVLCGSENKQQLFPYNALIDWFLQPRRSVYCTVRPESYAKYSVLHTDQCLQTLQSRKDRYIHRTPCRMNSSTGCP